MNILIADDQQEVRKTIKKAIISIYPNVNIYEAWDGFKAASVLAGEEIDLILLDINMPGINGLEVVDFINKEPRMGNPHIVIVTGSCKEPMRKRLLLNGAKEIIKKPFDFKELKRVLKKYIIG